MNNFGSLFSMCLALLFACSFASCDGGKTAADAPMNVIYIMADDLGYYHVGFNAELSDRPSPDVAGVTPNIDKLAKNGVILKRHYVHWHCSPSRISKSCPRQLALIFRPCWLTSLADSSSKITGTHLPNYS